MNRCVLLLLSYDESGEMVQTCTEGPGIGDSTYVWSVISHLCKNKSETACAVMTPEFGWVDDEVVDVPLFFFSVTHLLS